MDETGGSAGGAPVVVPGFRVLRRLGEGGFATVFEAVQEDVDAPVALKVLSVDSSDARVRARFERECRAMGRLRSRSGIVPIYQAVFAADSRPVIVMGFMPGGSLLDRVRREGAPSVGEAVAWGARLGRALQAAHEVGIFHRDIKPENVLFDDEGQPALADFGIAIVDDLLASTRTEASLTPPHAPPERFLGSESPDLVAGDVYSLASTLYQVITGRPPFGSVADGGLVAWVNRVVSDPVPPITRADVPAGVAETILAALAKDPTERPRSAAEFAARLSEGFATSGAESAVPPVSSSETIRGSDADAARVAVAAAEPDDGAETVVRPVTAAEGESNPTVRRPDPARTETKRPRRRRRFGVLAVVGVVAVGVLAAGLILQDDSVPGRVAATIPVGDSPVGVAFGAGS
ncbi:MAG: serine/threonine-protein kinase, partial [Actinomycetota bacterium]